MNIKKSSYLLALCAISFVLSACQHHTEILGLDQADRVELPVVPVSTSHVLPQGAIDETVISKVGVTRLATPTAAVLPQQTYVPAVSNNKQLVRALRSYGFEATENSRGVLAYLPSPNYFDTNKAVIKPTMISKLRQFVSETNKQYVSNRNILVYGHTDTVGNQQANLALSTRRANAVQRKLIDLGSRSSRLSTRSFGESAPRFSKSTEYLNRRVEFLVLN